MSRLREIGVVGSFEHMDSRIEAIAKLREEGYHDLEVYSPVPRHEIEAALARPKSPVKFITFGAAMAGLATAWRLERPTEADAPIPAVTVLEADGQVGGDRLDVGLRRLDPAGFVNDGLPGHRRRDLAGLLGVGQHGPQQHARPLDAVRVV